MPIDYKKYPSNWKTQIRPSVLKRAENSCEFCKVPNYSVGYREDLIFYPIGGNIFYDKAGNGELSHKEARELVNHCKDVFEEKFIVIVLTIAHLDHNIKNNDLSNLKALCQKCHLDYDKEHHKKNRVKSRKVKKGLIGIFDS